MPYPPEIILSIEEEQLISKIRNLTGDIEEVFIDDVTSAGVCSRVKMNGSLYELEEPKGYPINIYVNGVEFTDTTGPFGVVVIGDKYLRFTDTSGVLNENTHLVVIYNHFRNSDVDILNLYDTGARVYLTAECNLSDEDLGEDLLALSTAYALLTKDMSEYVSNAVDLSDSDSRYNASNRPNALAKLLQIIGDRLKHAIEVKTRCKMLRLPVYKVE